MKTITASTISFYGDINNFKAINLLQKTLGEIIDLDMLSSEFSEGKGYNTITVEFLDGYDTENEEFNKFLDQLADIGAIDICVDDVSYTDED